MMLLCVRPTPFFIRPVSSAAGNPLPRTIPARSLVPTKTSGSRFIPALSRQVFRCKRVGEALAPLQPRHRVLSLGALDVLPLRALHVDQIAEGGVGGAGQPGRR